MARGYTVRVGLGLGLVDRVRVRITHFLLMLLMCLSKVEELSG